MDLKKEQAQVPPRLKITPDMMRSFKTLECVHCGEKIFRSGIIFKKISSLVSPTGKEELYPIEVMICDKCGSIPKELDIQNIIPEDMIAKEKKFNLNKK